MICAGIDIGTNTILMVIGSGSPADESNSSTSDAWTVIEDIHRIARLGEGLDSSGYIHEGAVARASEILNDYRLICERLGVEKISAVATSAIRNATNAENVKKRLEVVLGAPIEVISGLNEATLTFTGVATKRANPSIVIDIGGGSTEYISGFSRIVYGAHSLEIGTVRFAERFGLGGNASAEQIVKARNLVHRELLSIRGSLTRFPTQDIIAVAGTPTSLAILDLGLTSFSKEKVEGYTLSARAVEYWADRLLGMSQSERLELPGIDPNRVDILPAGALILDQSLKDLELQRCIVSAKGLRYGVMMR